MVDGDVDDVVDDVDDVDSDGKGRSRITNVALRRSARRSARGRGEGASDAPKRFIDRRRVDALKKALDGDFIDQGARGGRDDEGEGTRGGGMMGGWGRRMMGGWGRRATRISRAFRARERGVNDAMNSRRLALSMYILFSITMEHVLMRRGVQVGKASWNDGWSGVFGAKQWQRLRDAAEPELFLRGLYSRYLPTAIVIDALTLLQFVRVDAHGRPTRWLEDVGFIFRHLVRSIMRHPAVTLTIVGYKHPGHTFSAQQVALLLAVPTILMNRLGLFESPVSQLVVALINFMLYPMYSCTVIETLPVYIVQGRSHVSMKLWIAITLLSPVCWLHARWKEYWQSRSERSQRRFFKNRALDGFKPRGSWVVRFAYGELSSARCNSQVNVSVQQLAQAFGTTEKALIADFHGARIALSPKESNSFTSTSMSGALAALLREVVAPRPSAVLRVALDAVAACYRTNVVDIFGNNQEAFVDYNKREVWAWTTSRDGDLNTEGRIRDVFKSVPAYKSSSEQLARVRVDTPLGMECFARVSGPLRLMRTHKIVSSTQKTTICYSNVVAVVTGSVNVIQLHGRGFHGSRMYIRVGSSSIPVGSSLRRMQSFDVAAPRGRIPNAAPDDANASSIDQKPLEHTTVVICTAACDVLCVGHLVIQIFGEFMSYAFPLIVTNDLDVKNELNERFGCVHLSNVTTLFLHTIGRALADSASCETTTYLARVAYDNDLPHVANALNARALARSSPHSS